MAWLRPTASCSLTEKLPDLNAANAFNTMFIVSASQGKSSENYLIPQLGIHPIPFLAMTPTNHGRRITRQNRREERRHDYSLLVVLRSEMLLVIVIGYALTLISQSQSFF